MFCKNDWHICTRPVPPKYEYMRCTNSTTSNNYVLNFAGIIIGIGAIMDEAVLDQYLYKTPCAKARKILVCLWIFLGFLITISYKSVLLANMTYRDYERGIDSIEDMLNSGKPLMVIRSMDDFFENDPRPQVIELTKNFKFFDFVRNEKSSGLPQWVIYGYGILNLL